MFHKMPGNIGPITPIQDRVFHVLVVTAQSTHLTDASTKTSRSFVIQLPVNFDSFSDVRVVQERSHIKKRGTSWFYYLPPPNGEVPSDARQPTDVQRRRRGNKLVEGTYVSLERILGAPKMTPETDHTPIDPAPIDLNKNHHMWDMVSFYLS